MLLLGFALAACLLDSPLPGVVLHSLDRDPLVWKLTEPIESRLFAVGDRSLPLGQRIQLDLRLRERAGDRARYVMSRVTQPTGRDLDAASLPSVLSFLYLPIRLARLAGAYIAHPSRLRRLLIGGNTEESSG
jgi:hypothetical protein